MRISDWSSDVCSSDLRKLKYQTASDIDSTSALVAPIYQAEQDTQFSQELQLSGKHDRLNWLVGLFYFREKDNGQLAIPFDNFARSEERRVGRESVSTCRSSWSPDQ